MNGRKKVNLIITKYARVCVCVRAFIYQCTVSCAITREKNRESEREANNRDEARRVRTTAVRTKRSEKPGLQAHYHRDRHD
ncbi:hypothetical protein M5D96_006591, partial [Drosophila gunungcola]